MKKNILLVLIYTFVGIGSVNAQLDVSANGLGRAVLTNNKLSGNLLDSDTASARKGLSGYNLFDLGLNLDKGRELKGNLVMRVRQAYGDFWGEQTRFEFRQMQLKGDLRWLSYEIGDIDVKNTPYTVSNFDEVYNKFEAPVFRARRDIVQYENFNRLDVWRMQGVKLGTEWYVGKKNLETIRLNVFGVRTDVTDNFLIADRILSGARLDVLVTDKYTIAANYVGLHDIKLDAFPIDYQNDVVTGLFDVSFIRKENFKSGIFMEGGSSQNRYYRKADDSTYTSNDFFVDGGLKAELKNGAFVKVSYQNVGARFSSPGAQTPRINVGATPLLFSNVLNSSTNRSQLLFDRFTQEVVYNRSISPVMQAYNPAINNVSPYGAATPNRIGYTLELGNKGSDKLEVHAVAKLANELVGEGTSDKRNFLAAQGGAKIGLGALMSMERRIELYLGSRYEKTQRNGGVDLSSTISDAGLMVQIFKQLDVLGGYKLLSAKGDEILVTRNEINYITSYTPVSFDLTEQILSYGIRISFNESANFYVVHNIVENKNGLNQNLNYKIGQLFMNFNVMF